MPLPIGKSVQTKYERLATRQARNQEMAAKEAGRLEKAIARARFIAGKLVLDDPDLYNRLSVNWTEQLERLGSSRTVLDEYRKNQEDLMKIKSFL